MNIDEITRRILAALDGFDEGRLTRQDFRDAVEDALSDGIDPDDFEVEFIPDENLDDSDFRYDADRKETDDDPDDDNTF
jgi:hypothetical protein